MHCWRIFKSGIIGLAIIAGLILTIAVFSPKYAALLTLTFVNAEASMLGWKALGTPIYLTILFTLICSTIDIYGWFYLANITNPLAKKFLSKRGQQKAPNWLSKIAAKSWFVALWLCGFTPGLIWIGVIYAKIVIAKLGVSEKKARNTIIFGNSVKIILCTLGVNTLYLLLKDLCL